MKSTIDFEKMETSILNEITSRLVRGFNPEKIILFGSRARNEATDRSDVDLLVICKDGNSRYRLMVEMDRALRGILIGRDIVVMTPEEFERGKHLIGSIAQPASLEGQILYERRAN